MLTDSAQAQGRSMSSEIEVVDTMLLVKRVRSGFQ